MAGAALTGAAGGAALGSVAPGVGTLLGAGVGAIGGGLVDLLGGNAAADAQKQAQGQARTDLTTGYDAATGYEKPLYDTGVGNLTSLSDKYAAGGFSNPHMDPYHQDPNAVFQDPEYQAQMRAGTQAINGNAEVTGKLFSGSNDKDLMKFGQDTFAGRSDALYNRGFNATNTAFNQNALSNQTGFNEGASLAGYAQPAASNLSNLAVGQGTDLANNDLGTGAIRANNINRTTGDLTGMIGDVSGLAANPQGQLGKMFQSKSSLVN